VNKTLKFSSKILIAFGALSLAVYALVMVLGLSGL